MSSIVPRLILASRSAQRARLLTQAGYAFAQADPPFADPPQPEHPPEGHADAVRTAASLAAEKALSLGQSGIFGRCPGALILAADTICVGVNGRMLGQPADRDEARTMIMGFLGLSHEVVTGVALLGANDAQPERLVEAAVVSMGLIDVQTLEEYLDTQQWRGKAGGYNLFDRQRAGWPVRVQGDPTTVVGLPMRALAEALSKRGVRPDPSAPMADASPRFPSVP